MDSSAPAVPASADEVRAAFTARPVGRTPWSLRSVRLQAAGAASALDAVAPVAGDVMVGVILDLPDADVPVSDGMLAQWGMTLDQALSAAVSNRAAVAPQVQAIDNVHLVTSMPYAAYILRAPDAVAGLIPGRTPVIVVPTAGHVIVANAEDPSSVALAARVAERILQSDDHGVSVTPLVRSGSGWATSPWPAEAAEPAAALQRRWDVAQYAAQRPSLEQHFASLNGEYVVAEAALVQRDGRTMTYTTFTEGVATVLPWVDVVALVASDGTVTQVPMQTLAETPGVLTRMPDAEPVLVYATRFPSELIQR